MSIINQTFLESSAAVLADLPNGSENWTHGNGTPPAGRNQFVLFVQEPLTSTVFKVLACVIVIVFSLVGNSLTIGSVYQNVNRRMRTQSNYLIVNLCFAYLLITVCNVPRLISIVLVGYEWLVVGTFGLLTCKINSAVPFISLLVSTLSFAFIALDRFLAVFFPLRRPMTGKIMAAIIIFTWVLPCCCYYLPFHYAILININGKTYCANALIRDLLKTSENYRTYLICDFVFTQGFPLTTTIALYTAIGVKMCTRRTPGNQTASGTARNRTVNRKVISMLTTVVIVFCICWMPSWVAIAGCLTVPAPGFCNSISFSFIRYFMSYANSAITPYIYPIFNQNFRAGYLHILRQTLSCCCGKICPRLNINQVHPQEGSMTTNQSGRTERPCFNTTEL